MTLRSLAVDLQQSLAAGERDGQRLRLVRQFLMDLERADDPAAVISDEPMSTGDERWDALLAGVVEDFAFHRSLPVPRWTVEPSRFLDQWWFVSSIRSMHPTALVETPAAIANRGVFLRRSSLVNV